MNQKLGLLFILAAKYLHLKKSNLTAY